MDDVVKEFWEKVMNAREDIAEPERALMLEVLLQGLKDKDLRWIASTREDWLYSFEVVCRHVGLDSMYIRQNLPEILVSINGKKHRTLQYSRYNKKRRQVKKRSNKREPCFIMI